MRRIRYVLLCVALFSAVPAWAVDWSTNLDCFLGGDYDGWDKYPPPISFGTNDVPLEDAVYVPEYLSDYQIAFSSATNQLFDWTTPSAALTGATISVISYGTNPPIIPIITNGITMRISVPSAWQCRFDTSSVPTYSGSASGKVGPPTFSGDARSVLIPVTSDFVTNPVSALTVSGMKLADLRLVGADPAYLELDCTGDGARDLYDRCWLQVTANWPGGDYDGWDCLELPDYVSLHGIRGTVIWISLMGPNSPLTRRGKATP